MMGYYAAAYLREGGQRQASHLLISGLATLVMAAALPVWLGVVGGAEMLALALFINVLRLVMRRIRSANRDGRK